jgi:hypothetical protein
MLFKGTLSVPLEAGSDCAVGRRAAPRRNAEEDPDLGCRKMNPCGPGTAANHFETSAGVEGVEAPLDLPARPD